MHPLGRSLVVLVLLVACGGKKIEEIPLGHEQKEKAPDAERLAERRKQREAEAAAQREAEAAKTAALDAACALPASVPKDLDKACAGVGEAWDAFMQRRYADDPEVIAKWNESRTGQLPFALTQCKKFGSIEVAACQSNALANLPLDVQAEAPEVMAHCAQKCGKELPPTEMPQ
jgi:hypothetical protein